MNSPNPLWWPWFEKLSLTEKLVVGGAAALGGWLLIRGYLERTLHLEIISYGDLTNLHPEVEHRARQLVQNAHREGIPLIVTDGYRSIAEQDALYAKGRTEEGPIVTYVKGGYSWHNYGRAIDVAPLKNDKPYWPEDPGLWNEIGQLGEALGFKWGGRWTKPDRPHFEWHPGLTIQDMLKGQGQV